MEEKIGTKLKNLVTFDLKVLKIETIIKGKKCSKFEIKKNKFN